MNFFRWRIPSKLKKGLSAIKNSPCKLGIFCAYLIWWIGCLNKNWEIVTEGFHGLIERLEWCLLVIYGFFGALILLMILGIPVHIYKVQQDLKRIGLKNYSGETPCLLGCAKSKEIRGMKIWRFENCGIPLEEWMEKTPALETALNVCIQSIDYGKSLREIVIVTVPVKKLPDKIIWKDELLSPHEFELTLGQSRTGTVTVNLVDIPHMLIGGSTGSGKSVLMKLLIWQAMKKGADVYIVDFKGGVDYGSENFRRCRLYLNGEELLDLLDRMVQEIEKRKQLLAQKRCRDISHYNQKYNGQMKHEILFLDELAEILDKHGLTKEEERIIQKIERRLSTIARDGRAEGVHLVISMQRPDADVLKGQIKNNIDFRVCGRAEITLSKIILDNGEASKRISKKDKGRFLTYDGTVFQAYYLEEEWEMSGEYDQEYVSLDEWEN